MTMLTDTMRSAGAQLRQNRRLAIGAAVAALLVWVLALLALDGAIDGARARIETRQRDLARAARLADRDWTTVAAEAAARRADAEQRLWPIANEGLARAEFQEWITVAARNAGLARVQTRLELGEAPGAGPRRLVASLTADLDGPALERLLATLATAPRLIVVQTMRLSEAPVPRVDLLLATFGATNNTEDKK
ncbi:hypothetical protein [Roseiterribacter gracilis]|uniref:Type II secretion system protein M n=1 Tax=Roseiterribacter gracilis TaxID=2812848 RepID=A0A8S8XL22_9PROT|nr:hypothetical protein TMPK1_40320 [Rhodospirillales bacterium TMPK1]